jgi:Endonuclease/Exonuclease/phosphatase family
MRGILALLIWLAPALAAAETLRIATYNVDLSRNGPGLLLRDLLKGDPQAAAVAEVIRAVRPDVLLVTGFDHDLRGRALAAFLELVRAGKHGVDYGFVFAPPVNAGVPSGLDLDLDGLRAGWDDGWGWGRFPGHGGMALLSRLPIDGEAARTFREFRWRDLPEAAMPLHPDGAPWPSAAAHAEMRLSSRSHWDVPVTLPGGGRLHLLAAYPTPPLFDGPEGRNLRRNHDEIAFWRHYLDGAAVVDDQARRGSAPAAPLVVLGDLNADPMDGDGLRQAIQRLLAHPRLRDPAPQSAGAAAAAAAQGGVNAAQSGPPALDTADWRDDANGPGNLRVDYVLPSTELEVAASGVYWPSPGEAMAEVVAEASDHRVVWVDVALP